MILLSFYFGIYSGYGRKHQPHSTCYANPAREPRDPSPAALSGLPHAARPAFGVRRVPAVRVDALWVTDGRTG
jgi:hypothetical protein